MSGPAALYTEVKLYDSAAERERYDNLAELYALLNTLEHLEKAYIRDAVQPKEYTAACSKLLVQIKAASKLMEAEYRSVESFVNSYGLKCPAALERISENRPITIKDDKGNTSKCIADIVSLFITIMDKLKLEIRAVDELHPDLRDLLATMNRMSSLPSEYEGRAKLHQWLDTLDSMRATDELDSEQARQMVFDIEYAYNAFNNFLHNA